MVRPLIPRLLAMVTYPPECLPTRDTVNLINLDNWFTMMARSLDVNKRNGQAQGLVVKSIEECTGAIVGMCSALILSFLHYPHTSPIARQHLIFHSSLTRSNRNSSTVTHQSPLTHAHVIRFTYPSFLPQYCNDEYGEAANPSISVSFLPSARRSGRSISQRYVQTGRLALDTQSNSNMHGGARTYRRPCNTFHNTPTITSVCL